MKVNIILTVEWTTQAVENEPEQIKTWPGVQPWP